MSATKTRADRLIEAAEFWSHRRRRDSDVDRLSYECGMLRADIRNLCAELDVFKHLPNPSCHYINLMLGQVALLVGYGADGDDDFSVNEVWCNGQRIDGLLPKDTLEKLAQDTIAALAEMREDARTEQWIANREWAREAA